MAFGIRELAQACGVSIGTVSRALNDHPDVSDATRRHVRETARRLGYRPNQSARALVRGRSDTVGLLWDTGYEAKGRQHPFLQAMLVGVKRALARSGRHLLLLDIARDDEERAYLDVVRQHQLAGIVMMGVDPSRPAVRGLTDAAVPCVGIDTELHGSHASYVTSDNHAGAITAVRHLHTAGHRRIATITGQRGLLATEARLTGFHTAAEELGLDLPAGYVQEGDFFLDSGYAAALRLLDLSERPTAVFIAGDEMAIGALHAFEDHGISVPGDIAVVGFDDVEAASLVRPALTTIAQDAPRMGVAVVDLLLDLLNRDPLTAEDREPVAAIAPRTVPTRLIVRSSCGIGGH